MEFIKKYKDIILVVLFGLLFLKGCSDSRKLNTIEKNMGSIKGNTYTKKELSKELKIMGLESEKRMIQSTDRKLMDLNRQSEIDLEIKKLQNGEK